MPLILFIDSDVVISSLLSSKGAAFLLINNTTEFTLYVSNHSKKELDIVVTRLGISINKLNFLLENKLNLVQLKQTVKEAKRDYIKYVTDENDAHIVLGAMETKARFLISYNIRHFNIEKIKIDFDILVMTPGQFLQYIRSLQ